MKKNYILPILTTSIVLTSVLPFSSCDEKNKDVEKPKSILDNYSYSKKDKKLTNPQSNITLENVVKYSLFKVNIYNSRDKKPENKIGIKTYIYVFKKRGKRERTYIYTQDLKNYTNNFYKCNIITLGERQYLDSGSNKYKISSLYTTDLKNSIHNVDYVNRLKLLIVDEYKYIWVNNRNRDGLVTQDLKHVQENIPKDIKKFEIIQKNSEKYLKITYEIITNNPQEPGRPEIKRTHFRYYSIDLQYKYDEDDDNPN